MINTVKEYLEQLKIELAACDPATIQDALSDAEEHLVTAIESMLKESPKVLEEDVISTVIEKYGNPVEIAAAYKEIEATMILPLVALKTRKQKSFPGNFFGVFADPQAWGALLYMIIALITGIIYFTWAVMGISTTASLLILLIGPPFAILFLLSVRGIAFLEGRLVEAMLGVRMPRRPRFFGKKAGWWGKVKYLLLDRSTWTAIIYMLIQLPLGILYFTFFLVLILISIQGIFIPITLWLFEFPVIIMNNIEFYAPIWLLPVMVIGGFLLLTITMHLARLIGIGHGKYAKAMLIKD
jgi:hypothetical protein